MPLSSRPPHPTPIRPDWTARASIETPAMQMDRFCQREFQIDYQPIVAFDQGQLLGFEALLHLRPERQRWYDDRLMTMVHSTQLGQPVETWVVDQVCQQLQQWQRTWPQLTPLLVSLNLSRQQMSSRSLLHHLERLVSNCALDPTHLQLEIPTALLGQAQRQRQGPSQPQAHRPNQGQAQRQAQSQAQSQTQGQTQRQAQQQAPHQPPSFEPLSIQGESLALLLKRFHRLGVRLILDDFSPTLMNTRALSQFPIEAVKISQALIDFLSARPQSRQMLETVFTQLDRQGIAVMPKRIETSSQLSLLQTMDRDRGQGFLFSRPIGSLEATTLINQERYCKRRSLHSYLRAMTKISQAMEHWLGPSLVRRYWQQTQSPIIGLGSLGTPMDGLRALPESLLISAVQEQQLRSWVQAFVTHVKQIMWPADQAIRWRSNLEAQERDLLGLS